jgi:hypothetical protein
MSSRPENDGLAAVIEEAKALLSLRDNDFSWSSWPDAPAATAELDAVLRALRDDERPDLEELRVLFAPTGPLQEVSLSSGWADRFLLLAAHFDRELEKIERNRRTMR